MRRDFLQYCAMTGLSLAVPFRLPRVRAAEKHLVVPEVGAVFADAILRVLAVE